MPSAVSSINNLRSFAMIFCFSHLNSNRCFDSFLRKFNTITENLGKFLKREKRLHLRFLTVFWIHLCRVIYIQKHSSIGNLKGSFSEKFFKISRKVSLTEYFSTGVLLCEAAFLNWFLTPTLRIIQSFLIPQSLLTVITYLPQHKKERKGKEKVIK